LAGFFAGFTACCELPAAAFAVSLFGILAYYNWRTALFSYVPAALIPVAALLFTNYLALGTVVPVYSKLDSPWYQYEGSIWNRAESGVGSSIDFLDENKAVYAAHLLFGHHGLFVLTPIWLLAVGGMIAGTMKLVRKPPTQPIEESGRSQALVAGMTLLLTIVVIGFYIVNTNNYGGWTNGPRWLMWLTPFCLLVLLPAADWLAPRRWGRWLGYAFLAVSVLSVSYRDWNPWRHPWTYNLMEALRLSPY
jgi:hypothetical protein